MAVTAMVVVIMAMLVIVRMVVVMLQMHLAAWQPWVLAEHQ